MWVDIFESEWHFVVSLFYSYDGEIHIKNPSQNIIHMPTCAFRKVLPAVICLPVHPG